MIEDQRGPAQHQTEADLRAVLDNMTDVFFRTDPEGRLQMASRSIETLLGWPRAELLGRPVQNHYVDLDQRDSFIHLTDAQGGRASGVELELRRADGGSVWVSASARRLPPEQGGGLEGVLHDISDRRRAEEQARRSGALVQALLNATSDATMLIDAHGTLLACNRVFAERFGRSVDAVVGQDLFSIFPPEVADRRRAACAQALKTGETVILRDRRQGRHFANTITPVPSPDGNGMVAVFSRDVSDEVADKARLQSYVDAIRRSNEELEQFAYVASHDLREPLRQISSYIGLLERRLAGRLDAEATEFMAFARTGAQRLDSLILDLLAFSRVTRTDDDKLPLPVVQVIAEARAAFDLERDGVQLDIEIDPGLMVVGNQAQLARLFQNLIGNAVKYRSPDRPPQLRISARRDGANVRVAVSDNGIGIEGEYYERIFRIFQRLHPHHKYQGTGIGLAIVKRVAENHGGSVGVESVPGQGSTFTVTLPLAG